MRSPIGVRDCVNGPFCRVIAFKWKIICVIAWIDLRAWCGKVLFCVRAGVKMEKVMILHNDFEWLRENGKTVCVIAWKWKKVRHCRHIGTSTKWCVDNAGQHHRCWVTKWLIWLISCVLNFRVFRTHRPGEILFSSTTGRNARYLFFTLFSHCNIR